MIESFWKQFPTVGYTKAFGCASPGQNEHLSDENQLELGFRKAIVQAALVNIKTSLQIDNNALFAITAKLASTFDDIKDGKMSEADLLSELKSHIKNLEHRLHGVLHPEHSLVDREAQMEIVDQNSKLTYSLLIRYATLFPECDEVYAFHEAIPAINNKELTHPDHIEFAFRKAVVEWALQNLEPSRVLVDGSQVGNLVQNLASAFEAVKTAKLTSQGFYMEVAKAAEDMKLQFREKISIL